MYVATGYVSRSATLVEPAQSDLNSILVYVDNQNTHLVGFSVSRIVSA
jgi:hypothetical protein